MPVSGIGDITITSLNNGFSRKIGCYITKTPTDCIPINSFSRSNFKIPEGITLANPEFNVSGPIDLILNAEILWEILSSKRINLRDTRVCLADTAFGWIVGGVLDLPSVGTNSVSCKATVADLNKTIEKFWTQEEITSTDTVRTDEEIKCENQFVNTYRRDKSDGRFIIKLPFKDKDMLPADSCRNATNRFIFFISVERRFRNDPEFKKCYVETFNEYQNLGTVQAKIHSFICPTVAS